MPDKECDAHPFFPLGKQKTDNQAQFFTTVLVRYEVILTCRNFITNYLLIALHPRYLSEA